VGDPQDKKITQHVKRHENEKLIKAINTIADTEAGVIFFRWLRSRCFGDRSTIVGNPQTFEINTMGSVCQAFLQRLYFDIRRSMEKRLRQRIEQ